jgi:cation transport protein ChaC
MRVQDPARSNWMWIFGYGSLMWDGWESEFACQERTMATLSGYRRAFNKLSVANWGTKEAPCPTLNLQADREASCQGMAFAFAAVDEDAVLARLQKREGKSFMLTPLSVRLDDGMPVAAYAPLYSGRNLRSELKLDDHVRMVRAARGTSGSGIDYVKGIAESLEALGIEDPAVRSLRDALDLATGT